MLGHRIQVTVCVQWLLVTVYKSLFVYNDCWVTGYKSLCTTIAGSQDTSHCLCTMATGSQDTSHCLCTMTAGSQDTSHCLCTMATGDSIQVTVCVQ